MPLKRDIELELKTLDEQWTGHAARLRDYHAALEGALCNIANNSPTSTIQPVLQARGCLTNLGIDYRKKGTRR